MQHFKDFFDGVAISVGAAALLQIIPVVTGILTIVWLIYRIKDMRLAVKLKEKQLGE
jgi:hypothetical protein